MVLHNLLLALSLSVRWGDTVEKPEARLIDYLRFIDSSRRLRANKESQEQIVKDHKAAVRSSVIAAETDRLQKEFEETKAKELSQLKLQNSEQLEEQITKLQAEYEEKRDVLLRETEALRLELEKKAEAARAEKTATLTTVKQEILKFVRGLTGILIGS